MSLENSLGVILEDGAEISPASEHDPIEYFFASCSIPIIHHTNRIIQLENYDIASVKNGELSIHRLRGSDPGDLVRYVKVELMEPEAIMKGGYDTFMLKEINEQPSSLRMTMAGRVQEGSMKVTLGGIEGYIGKIREGRRLLILACGTSYISAVATRQFMEDHTRLPVTIDLASDFLDRSPYVSSHDVCIFISQSGETADTLAALRHCKSQGALIIGITNRVGSAICAESDCGVHINAGIEIGVASTKAYTSQIVSLVMFALVISENQNTCDDNKRKEIIQGLIDLPQLLEEVLKQDENISEIAKSLHEHKSLLILGRGYNFATCLEAALKVKELTYMHSEGIQTGELKHGPLALVDEYCKMILFMTRDSTFDHAKLAANQIIARNGMPIIVCEQGDDEAKEFAIGGHFIEVPRTVPALQGIVSVVPMQLLAYHIAKLLKLDVDRPRNLAKSVTVQ